MLLWDGEGTKISASERKKFVSYAKLQFLFNFIYFLKVHLDETKSLAY
jgi:hypothetical protein